jgi:hypothetical protein
MVAPAPAFDTPETFMQMNKKVVESFSTMPPWNAFKAPCLSYVARAVPCGLHEIAS